MVHEQQPWESVTAFGMLLQMLSHVGFMMAKKNAIAKVFTYVDFLFRFYSVVDNS